MWSYLVGIGLGLLYVAASVVPAVLFIGLLIGWPGALPLLALSVVLIFALQILLERDRHERRKRLRATVLGVAGAVGILLAIFAAIGVLRWMGMRLPETDGWVGMAVGLFFLLRMLRSWLVERQSARPSLGGSVNGK